MASMKRISVYLPEELNLRLEIYRRDFATPKTEFIRQAIRYYFAYLSDGDRRGVENAKI